MARVRLFAAAAEAAGTDETTSAAPTVGALVDELAARYGADLERVLRQCSVVVDRVRSAGDDAIREDALVDVLPPFAGG